MSTSNGAESVWAERVDVVMTEGLKIYVQWMFQWADSSGGGCIDCTVGSPILLHGFEAFRSANVQFIRARGLNATFALNTYIQGDHPYLSQGGRIENLTMVQRGYINERHDSLMGININEKNANVTVVGGSYSAPDYWPGSDRHGAQGLNSTGRNTTVEDFSVTGTSDFWGNINISDGVVRRCSAAVIKAPRIEN
ncbi:hypothetical protein JQX13_19840 [Archangium violaceum]|uniref:hypothetical protein n=1 Tax=Archangium violaceum TaxID=83451 RepID=UPI00193B7770|nr:hypothetical protein [Archangium violaceum]QRK12095.1 hypothetical protein JQX13_19840 [Archangium violaceum]